MFEYLFPYRQQFADCGLWQSWGYGLPMQRGGVEHVHISNDGTALFLSAESQVNCKLTEEELHGIRRIVCLNAKAKTLSQLLPLAKNVAYLVLAHNDQDTHTDFDIAEVADWVGDHSHSIRSLGLLIDGFSNDSAQRLVRSIPRLESLLLGLCAHSIELETMFAYQKSLTSLHLRCSEYEPDIAALSTTLESAIKSIRSISTSDSRLKQLSISAPFRSNLSITPALSMLRDGEFAELTSIGLTSIFVDDAATAQLARLFTHKNRCELLRIEESSIVSTAELCNTLGLLRNLVAVELSGCTIGELNSAAIGGNPSFSGNGCQALSLMETRFCDPSDEEIVLNLVGESTRFVAINGGNFAAENYELLREKLGCCRQLQDIHLSYMSNADNLFDDLRVDFDQCYTLGLRDMERSNGKLSTFSGKAVELDVRDNSDLPGLGDFINNAGVRSLLVDSMSGLVSAGNCYPSIRQILTDDRNIEAPTSQTIRELKSRFPNLQSVIGLFKDDHVKVDDVDFISQFYLSNTFPIDFVSDLGRIEASSHS